MYITFKEYRDRIFQLLNDRPRMPLEIVKTLVDKTLKLIGIKGYYREFNNNGIIETEYTDLEE